MKLNPIKAVASAATRAKTAVTTSVKTNASNIALGKEARTASKAGEEAVTKFLQEKAIDVKTAIKNANISKLKFTGAAVGAAAIVTGAVFGIKAIVNKAKAAKAENAKTEA